MSATNCWKSSVVEAVDQVLEQTLGSEERRALLCSWFLLAEIDESAGNLLNRAGEGSAQNRANLCAKRFRVGACWIGAGIDRYEDELEFPRWTSIHASSSPRRPGCAPRISGSYARHDDLTTNLAWRTRSPSSGSRGGRAGPATFRDPRGPRGLCGNGAECESPRSRSLCAARAPQGRTATRPRPVRPLRPTGPTGSARLRTPNRCGELPASHPRSYHLYIRTRSLADPGTIEDVLAVENDVVPFDRADVLGAGLRPGLPW